MKKKSNILKLIEQLSNNKSNLTPKGFSFQGNISDLNRMGTCGVSEDDLESSGFWNSPLIHEVSAPELYEHLCYGIYNPPETKTSEY